MYITSGVLLDCQFYATFAAQTVSELLRCLPIDRIPLKAAKIGIYEWLLGKESVLVR